MFNQTLARAKSFTGDMNQYKAVATLGPLGTSSEQTAIYLSSKLLGLPAVSLFDTYESARDFSVSNDGSILLVANAYKSINEFYISDTVTPAFSFFFDTPAYGIAATPTVNLWNIASERDLKIASHHAPQHLIAKLLAQPNFTVIDASSTSAAARMVSEGHADACLTTAIACKHEELIFISREVDIHMLWTAFTKKVYP